MNAKRADKGKPCPRNTRNLWLGLMTVISSVLPQASAQAQAVASADRISIDYGVVTQHYQTSWSDPTLPAGVARGMPPSAMTSAINSLSDNESGASASSDTANDAAPTETADDSNQAAVLYAIDLGDDGMTMVVSAKTTLLPGDCVAVERSSTYFNLRGVNSGFCDPTNQATILGLQSANVAAAQRCEVAREKLEALTDEESQNLTPSELGMLCDGS
jgi:hypothetical protein